MGRKCMMSEGRMLRKCRPMSVDTISKLPDDVRRMSVVDMISKLSDDVLVHILSFLPLNQAATTSLLSQRWLHLWKYRTKFNISRENIRSVNRVNSVLKSLSLQEFTIEIDAIKSDRYNVAKWLEFAFSRRVERLELYWHCHDLCSDALALEDILENILPTHDIFRS